MDAVARTRALLDRGASVEEVARELRDGGVGVSDAISALADGAAMTEGDALTAIADSTAWKDAFVTQEWIDPPAPPEEDVLDRMARVCAQEPQVVEAWITGSRMTRSDGSSGENTGVTLVLDLPSGDPGSDPRSLQLAETLSAVAPGFEIGHWRFTADSLAADVESHGLKIYPRAA